MPVPVMLIPLLLGFDVAANILEWMSFPDRIWRDLGFEERSSPRRMTPPASA